MDYTNIKVMRTRYKEIGDTLRQWRENNERRSKDVAFLGFTVVVEFLYKYGNEKYLILEQSLLASMDCHNSVELYMYLEMLDKAFPGSLRVMRYKAMTLEWQEDYDDALKVLDEIIKIDETNAPARKRRVAVFKAQGLLTEAIKELVDYIKKFMADMEAWQELCELYLQAGEYSKAAFCAEELILHQPHNHLMHQHVADIRYTMGGLENLELAKTFYCQALKLNPDNIRALLGLFLVTNNLLNYYKSSGNSNKRKEIWKLYQWVQSQVSRKQKEAGTSPVLPELTNMMLSLAITD